MSKMLNVLSYYLTNAPDSLSMLFHKLLFARNHCGKWRRKSILRRSLVIGKEDIYEVYKDAPDAKIISVHMETLSIIGHYQEKN